MEHRRFTRDDWGFLPGAARFADGSEPFITHTFTARIGGIDSDAIACGDATAVYLCTWSEDVGQDDEEEEELWIMPLPNSSPHLISTILASLPSTLTENGLHEFGFKGGNRRLTADEVEARNAEVQANQFEAPRQAPWWFAFLALLGVASWGTGLAIHRRNHPDPFHSGGNPGGVGNLPAGWPKR